MGKFLKRKKRSGKSNQGSADASAANHAASGNQKADNTSHSGHEAAKSSKVAHRPAKAHIPLTRFIGPIITLVGIVFVLGLVVTGQVFNLNGLGQLFVDAVGAHDYAMAQALVMLVVTVFVFTNLFIDIVYGWLDPRIRYS